MLNHFLIINHHLRVTAGAFSIDFELLPKLCQTRDIRH